jgi:flagellar FliL protein
MSTDANAQAASPTAPAPKKSRKGLFIVLTLLIVLLAGAGGGAYWFLVRGAEAQAAEAGGEAADAEPEAEEVPTGIVPFEPFVVNLADPGVSRFLRVSLTLVADEEHAAELEHDEVALMRVRSAILELLSQQESGQLVTPEGKAELKESIAEAAAHAAHDLKVLDVLFTEFIVQY